MLELKLGKGVFVSKAGRREIKVPLRSVKLPVLYEYDIERDLARLPDIELVYQQLRGDGKDEADIIQDLIDIYLKVKIFRAGHFNKLQLVLGLIGPRGSGKTVGMVAIGSLEWLLRGEQVWSNVPFAIKVTYGDCKRVYSSMPLEQLDLLDLAGGLRGGLAIVDEANMTFAEAGRAMSGANLDFGYAIQQLRKRGLSVIWTCQGWGWIDNRLRWQTDLVISCRDSFLTDSHSEGIGARSKWIVSDLSSMTGQFGSDYAESHRFISQFEVWRGEFWNKPFWAAYDTDQLQGGEGYVQQYKLAKAGKTKQFEKQLVEARQRPEQEIVAGLLEQGITEFYSSELWQKYGITDRRTQTIIGTLLKDYFDKKETRQGSLYTLKPLNLPGT